MKIELYAIKDNLVGFSQPICFVSQAVAMRSFIASAQASEPNAINTYPENKELWKIGELDDQTGVITSDVVFVCKAVDYVRTSPVEVEHEKENTVGA